MPTITPKTVYPYKGKDHKSLKDIRSQVENDIGAIIDKLNTRLAPKQALNLLDVIIENKGVLVNLLTVEVDISESLHGSYANILDMEV